MPANFSKKWLFTITTFLLLVVVCDNARSEQTIQVARYDMLELGFQAQVQVDNPFTTYLLRVRLTAPDGRLFEIDGFYDGNVKGEQKGSIWKARVSPDQPGKWSWELIAGDIADLSLIGQNGSFECIDKGLAGGITSKDRYFQLRSGKPIYLQGNFLDFSNGLVSTHVYMSEEISDHMRARVLKRQRQQRVNKINVYLANKGDYGGTRVWPWLDEDMTRMDLKRWADFDQYIRDFKSAGLFAVLWFFADDSGFGKLAQEVKNQLFRYAMARTSAFSHTLYIIALEWQEGWSKESIKESGNFIQRHNPWDRLLSVHNLPSRKPDSLRSFLSFAYKRLFGKMRYSDELWADFIASQAGNSATPEDVNSLAVEMQRNEVIPHLSEEFGILREEQDQRLMRNIWANLLGGAAGGGTGSNISALTHFLELTNLPFQRLQPVNDLCKNGGTTVFCAADSGQHYVIYSMGEDVELAFSMQDFQGYWYDPLNPGALVSVKKHNNSFFPVPNKGKDWVLWLTRR